MSIKYNGLVFARELSWWLIGSLIALLIMAPIITYIDFNLWWLNALMVVGSINYLRYTIAIKHLPFFKNKWLKLIFFLLNIQFFIALLFKLQAFINQSESFALSEFSDYYIEMGLIENANIWHYITQEMIICFVVSLLAIVLLNIRILLSYFKNYAKRLD